jgi:hypothetical protein
MKRKVIVAHFKQALRCPPLGGSTFVNGEKQPGVELHTGIEAGFLTITYQGRDIGVPIANVSDLQWDKSDKPA